MKISMRNLKNPKELYYSVNGIEIPSRYFFAPINTGFSRDGKPLKEFIEFYQQRSGNGIGINYVGNVSIGPDYVTNKNTAYFTDQLEEWTDLTNIISKAGSLPGIQIACRNSTLTPIRRMINNKKEEYIKQVQHDLNKITIDEIYHIIDLFINSAKKAFTAGFKVLQIHAAHGYFLSQMLNEKLNVRKDEFGLDRLKVLTDIITGIRRELSHDVILDIRISLIDGLIEEQQELEYKDKLIQKLVQQDIEMISFSNGIYDINKQLIYPVKQWGHGVFIENVLQYAKNYPHILWNGAGNIWDLDQLKLESLPHNLTFSLGRALIADPKFVNKSLNNNKQSINQCERKGQCHYYSLGKENVGCPVYNSSISII
jgi:2,4-dienoyl-CoA reductase-like NADH-dependent reductase (Old Yellow Enzyme family)